jgi:hypothetical protein
MNFKNILTTLLIICCFQGIVGQSVLSTRNLELKKGRDYQEIVAAPEANYHGLTVFAGDKTGVTALRYTRVLYYADSLAAVRPDVNEYDLLAGYSYDTDGQPSAYWASNNLKKLQEVHFDFTAKAVTNYYYELPFKDEDVVTSFSENNSFYIITLPKLGARLKLYIFNQGRYVQRTLDFSKFSFTDADGNATSFTRLLKNYALQKTETGTYNPLPATVSKLKLYATKEAITLSFNQNPAQTQLFTIDAQTYVITEKVVKQIALKDGKSNSFLYGQDLYQVVLNKEELALSRVNLDSLQNTKTLKAGAEDNISFKNSALIEQTNNRQSEYKNTKRFLRRARGGDAAVSVYQTPNDLLVVTGAIRYIVPAENVAMGIAMMAAAGVDPSEMFPPDVQIIYFESLFDNDFNHKPLPQQRLAADYIGQYTAQNERNISLQTVFKYDYYYVMGYYDVKAKKYVLVKFQDDFVN